MSQSDVPHWLAIWRSQSTPSISTVPVERPSVHKDQNAMTISPVSEKISSPISPISAHDRIPTLENQVPYTEKTETSITDWLLQLSAKDVESLGRQRPACFSGTVNEASFVLSLVMSQVLVEYHIAGLNILSTKLATELRAGLTETIWPISSFSLVIASTLLIFGRICERYGGRLVCLCGLGWLTLWSLLAGFSKNIWMLSFCRAMMGLGPAAFLPAVTMLLGRTYRPGPRKNIVFSLYGAAAIFGMFIGILVAGLVGEYIRSGWYFWIGAILSFITTVSTYLSVRSDFSVARTSSTRPGADWFGSIVIVSGLVLTIFGITQSAHAPNGWRTPYVPATFAIGVSCLGLAFYVEGWYADQPLLPFHIFKTPSVKSLCVLIFLNSGIFGLFMAYGTRYFEDILRASTLQMVAWFLPMVGFGFVICLSGFVLHMIPGTTLLIVSALAWIASMLLLALAPVGANYWAFIFTSMICCNLGIDITFNIANIFLTTNMSADDQGLAGALINSITNVGVALLLGIGSNVQMGTFRRTGDVSKGYKAVFWYGVGCAALALLVVACFVRVDRARSDLTVDEKKRRDSALSENNMK